MTSKTMPNGYNLTKTKAEYENFYANSDFRHFGWVDKVAVKAIIRRYQLQGMKLLDVGCGSGWYTYLSNECGARAFGVDLAETGIHAAKEHYTPKSYLVGDGLALPFRPNSFDAIFCSGFSPFNAQHLDTLNELGYHLFSLLKPSGLFIFRKTTDLSGRKGSRMNHTLETFEQYFVDLQVGVILDSYIESPLFWALMGRWALSSVGTTLARLFTKLTGIPSRALIIVRK
ncbi:class I SAM-dependent methyltransferase [Chloroflexota bacterium]